MNERRRTTTSNFGVSARESHDSTPFYERFRPPELSDDDTVLPPLPVAEPFICGDARSMSDVVDGAVALVVTSPPYFAGKQYEEELDRDGVPASYLEYLEMLRDVFAECARKLEPGGRIAVNVANLGRKPYRSLSADIIRILEDDLGLLLRGELVWQKGEGASGSCAWGSFRSASNPVLRDISERVIVASKGRFERARKVEDRAASGLPHQSTVLAEDFMNATLDVWSMPTESARRVGHPAPFPIELPEQLIRLYTFRNDLVLDPFMGSGTSLVAASRLDRRYVGYDLDPAYVDIARRRVADEGGQGEDLEAPAADSSIEGAPAQKLAEQRLAAAGFRIAGTKRRIRKTSVTMSFVALDADGEEWYVDVAGSNTGHRGGLQKMDAVWKCLGRAHAVRSTRGGTPLLVLTTHLPHRPSEADTALRAAGPDAITDVIGLLDGGDLDRLGRYAAGGRADAPQPGFWP